MPDRLTMEYEWVMSWAEYVAQSLACRWDRLLTATRGMPFIHRWLHEVDNVAVLPLCSWLESHLGFAMYA